MSKFLLGSGIPQRIVGLPAEVLTTPLGAMIGNMMRGMQDQMGSRMGAAGGSADPFAGFPGSGSDSALGDGAAGSDGGGGTVPTSATGAASAFSAGLAGLGSAGGAAGLVQPSSLIPVSTRPLLSTEAGNTPAIIQRLQKVNASLPGDSPHRLSAADEMVLAALAGNLATPSSPVPVAGATASAAPICTDDGVCYIPTASSSAASSWQGSVCGLVSRILRQWPRAQAAFPSLAIIRLLVLREDCIGYLVSRGAVAADAAVAGAGHVPSLSASPAASDAAIGILWDILETASSAGAKAAASEGLGMYGTAPANVMALTVLSNAFKTPIGAAWAVSHSVKDKIIDVSIRELRNERAEIRQMCGALAYNLSNTIPAGSDTASPSISNTPGDATVQISDTSVQIMCAMLEELPIELDAEVVRRRLLAAGRILVREGPEACSLVQTLGFDAPVLAVMADTSRSHEVRALAAEVLQKIVSGAA